MKDKNFIQSLKRNCFFLFKVLYALSWFLLGGFLFVILIFGDVFLQFRINKTGIVILFLIAIAVALLPLPLKVLKSRRNRYLISGIVSLLFFVTFAGIRYESQRYLSVFSVEKWQNLEEYRYLMKDDLLENYSLIGKTENEVKALLGEPNNVYEYIYSYYLGRNGREFKYLEITFNEGLVEKFICIIVS